MNTKLPRLFLLVCVLGLYACANVPVRDPVFGIPEASHEPGVPLQLDANHWYVPYVGFGSVTFNSKEGGVQMSTGRPNRPGETHGALALFRRSLMEEGYEVEVEYRLLDQLRTFDPNPWETFWLFFSYRAHSSGKQTNYVVVKTNGLEVGKAWGKVDQSFSLTRDFPRLPENIWAKLRVQVGRYGAVRIFFNDQLVGELPSGQLFYQKGQIGLYAEDSKVEIRSVRIKGELTSAKEK